LHSGAQNAGVDPAAAFEIGEKKPRGVGDGGRRRHERWHRRAGGRGAGRIRHEEDLGRAGTGRAAGRSLSTRSAQTRPGRPLALQSVAKGSRDIQSDDECPSQGSMLRYSAGLKRPRAMARPREFDEERVLDAVMLTFWRKGFEATSAQDLVDATGLGRGSLYGAFSNKDGLFEQAILRYNGRSRENVERLRQPGPAIERLRELFISIIDADIDAAEKPGCLATNSAI